MLAVRMGLLQRAAFVYVIILLHINSLGFIVCSQPALETQSFKQDTSKQIYKQNNYVLDWKHWEDSQILM